MLENLLAATPAVLFLASVVISSWYGGRWPGVVSIILSALMLDYFFLSKDLSLALSPRDAVRLTVFALLSLLICWLSVGRKRAMQSLRQARDELEIRVERRTAMLIKANELLKGEIVERKRVEGERDQQTLILKESEQRYQELFENANDIVYTLDLEGNLTSLNKAGERVTGYVRAEMLGKPISRIIAPEYLESMLEMMSRKMSGEAITTYELELVAQDGRRLTLEVSSRLIYEQGQAVGVQGIARDITERKQAEEALRQSEERFAKAFESSPLALTITSLRTGRLLEVNETFTRLSGYTREEAVGHTTLELGLWARPSDRDAQLAMIAERGHVRNLEYRFRMKEGIELVGLLSAERLEIGGEPCTLTVIEDITGRKRAEAEREQLLAREQEARREAEAANRMKDEFLATVSHELRTPLNAILGWGEMLRTGRLEVALAERGLDTIIRNAKSQAQLIEDILDVSRIITGKLRLDARPVGLIPIINGAIDAVRPAAYAKEIELKTSLDPLVGSVTGDADRLQQVVWNLLSNAIKFTPSGGRTEVLLEQTGRSARIVVSDTGTGINREFLPHVFDRFRQADSSYTRRHGGLGLGLAIVRHLVEMHGGTVEANSDGEGHGASFTVTLPVLRDDGRGIRDERANAQSQLHPSSFIPYPSLSEVWALVVDDEADARELIKMTLEQHGAKVTAVASAAEAIAAIKQCSDNKLPCVILSDIGMPGEDGLSLISKVRAMEIYGDMPAIALTAYARDEDRARALSAGFEIHMAKPFNPSELIAAVASLARRDKPAFDS
jgi:PAS domain S-box-containing protein